MNLIGHLICRAERKKNRSPKSSKIVNRELAGPDEFKYMVSIEKENSPFAGGGSIIDER